MLHLNKAGKRGLMVRGLFSTSNMGRALEGVIYEPVHAADALAEMQQSLGRL